MEVSVSEGKAQLTDLVRRAEAGEEVILTRHGKPVARILPVLTEVDRQARLEFLRAVSAAGRAKALPGPSAARSADFLYGEDGLPE
jgi:prevent-host-death family protein